MKSWLKILVMVVGVALWGNPSFGADEAAPAAGGAPAAGLELEGGAAAAEGHHAMNFQTIVFGSGAFGVAIWLMLFGCSMLSVALTVDSFLKISPKKLAPVHVVEKVRAAMEQGDVVKAIAICDEEPCPLSSILKAGFSNVSEGYEVVQDAIGVAADLESEKILQRVTYLNVISNTTPMLGLIGTVQGMINAFFTLGSQAAGAAQQSMLAVNISHGLWATAVGLTIAVQATIFFYFFKNRAVRQILGMEALTLDLVKVLRNVEVVNE